MNKFKYFLTPLFIIGILLVGCNKEELPKQIEIPETELDFSQLEVQDFIWQGLNFWYLWKGDVTKLDDSRIEDDQVYYDLLSSYSDPYDFFGSLLYQPESIDVYSWIVDDYVTLENSFQGIIRSNGVKYQLSYETGSNNDLLGYVKYILPDSDAIGKDVKRGYIFDAIDGVQLTIDNYQTLLNQDTYTMNFADLNSGNPISNGKSVSLTQSEYKENPVYISKTIDVNGTKIGYLMYNGFDSGFEGDLDDAFASIKSEGATELVLDLRYNSGGYGYLAVQLASSVTGQFIGDVIKRDVFNADIQDYYDNNNPESLIDRFTDEVLDIEGEVVRSAISSLNLNKVYVLTTKSTASASEVVISGLNPHIDVVTIGTTTFGKYTGSLTLYDSDNLRKDGDNLNPNHQWAMQPIILKYTNKNNEDVRGGIPPTIEIIDRVSQFGELGEVDEPLLAKAIEDITGIAAKNRIINEKDLIELKELPSVNKFENDLISTKKLPFKVRNK